MRYEVDLIVNYRVTVSVETDDVLQIEEKARNWVMAPEGARVSVQEIRNVIERGMPLPPNEETARRDSVLPMKQAA